MVDKKGNRENQTFPSLLCQRSPSTSSGSWKVQGQLSNPSHRMYGSLAWCLQYQFSIFKLFLSGHPKCTYKEMTVQYRDTADPKMEQGRIRVLCHLHILFCNRICHTDWPTTHYAAHALLKFTPSPPALASGVLGLQA